MFFLFLTPGGGGSLFITLSNVKVLTFVLEFHIFYLYNFHQVPLLGFHVLPLFDLGGIRKLI